MDPSQSMKIDNDYNDYPTNPEDEDHVEYVKMRPLALVIEFAHTVQHCKCIAILLRAGADPLNECYYDDTGDDELSMDALSYLLQSMRDWLYTGTLDRMQVFLQILALLLAHTKEMHRNLPFASSTSNDAKQEVPLDHAIMLGSRETEHTEYVCWNAVSMLLACEHLCIHTRLGALNTALRHVKSTALCVRLCQKLLDAGVSVNEISSLRDLATDAFLIQQATPLVTATRRRGADCLVLTHLLLDAPHANPNLLVKKLNGSQHTCLSTAARHRTHARPLVRLLLSYGADPLLPVAHSVTLLDAMEPEAAALVREVMGSDASFMLPNKHPRLL
jgi:hypothetical protein